MRLYMEKVFAVIICWMGLTRGETGNNITYFILKGVPLPPSNITIHAIRKHDVLVRWNYEGGVDRPVSKFEMTIWPEYAEKEFMNVQLLQLAKIEPYLRQVRIYNLHPGTMYVAYMTAVNDEGVSNRTENVTFKTYTESQLFHPVDTLVVFGVLCLWCFAVTTFLHRWGSIRIVQPRDTRFKFKPKNLDTIRVCKRTTDSVIYKNYSRQMSFTLEKREEKLERMNTMKRIQIETEAGIAREKEETIKQKGRVLDKDEKRHIMSMMDQKKKLKKQLKVHHRDGTSPATRPKLVPKPGVIRGHHGLSRGHHGVKGHEEHDLRGKDELRDEFREEDEDVEIAEKAADDKKRNKEKDSSTDSVTDGIQHVTESVTTLEKVIVEPIPSTSSQEPR